MTTYNSTTYAAQITDPPTIVQSEEYFGRLRVAFFTYTAAARYNAGTDFNLIKLPAGRITLYAALSSVYCSDFGATSDTVDMGWAAYKAAGATVVADPNGLHDGQDVATAAVRFAPTNAQLTGKKQFISDDGVIITAVVPDADIPSGAVIHGILVFTID